MPVFGTGLPWKHNDLLGTTPLRIHVSDDLQTRLLQFAQTEISDFKTRALFGCDDDTGGFQIAGGARHCLLIMFRCNHR